MQYSKKVDTKDHKDFQLVPNKLYRYKRNFNGTLLVEQSVFYVELYIL